jgi:hypothetical protein
MIFELQYDRDENPVLVVPNNTDQDAWDWLDLLQAAFPSQLAYIVCWGQYDNAVKIIH